MSYHTRFCKKKSSERGCSELKFKQKSRSHDSKKLLLRILPSSIQTILSVPESHRFLRGCARGLYRRSGIAPCPEDIFRFYCYVLLLFMLLLQSRIVKREIFFARLELSYIQQSARMKNSQSVIDTADKSVDSSIALEVSTLSAFMFFAMIKQETVVGDPDIIRMAII